MIPNCLIYGLNTIDGKIRQWKKMKVLGWGESVE